MTPSRSASCASRSRAPPSSRAGVEKVLQTPEGLRRWYLSVIDELARAGVDVKVASIEGLEWGEMDFPQDVENLNRLSAGWTAPRLRRPPPRGTPA